MGSGSKQCKKRGRSAKLSKSASKSANDCSDQSEVSNISIMNSSSTSAQSSICIPDCAFSGSEGDMELIRCCTCMKLVHPICCGDTETVSSFGGIYNCISCRTLCDRVSSIEKQLSLSQELNQTLLKLVEKSNEECTNLRLLLNDIIQNGLTKSENIQKTTETKIQTKTADSVKQPLNPMAPPIWSITPKRPVREMSKPTPEPKNAEFTENLHTGSRIAAVPPLTETQPVNLTSSQPTAKPTGQFLLKLQNSIPVAMRHPTSLRSLLLGTPW